MPTFKAALAYFGIVFAVGFLCGPIRMYWLEPNFGATTAVLMEHDPSHLNTVSRRISKLVSLGLIERHKVINDNKRYEVAFKVPEALVEKMRRRRQK